MTLASAAVIFIMVILFAFAVVFIAKNDGWKGEACQGHCATCNHACAKRIEDEKEAIAKAQEAEATTDAP